MGTNRYAYAENDPINKSDPNGHQYRPVHVEYYSDVPPEIRTAIEAIKIDINRYLSARNLSFSVSEVFVTTNPALHSKDYLAELITNELDPEAPKRPRGEIVNGLYSVIDHKPGIYINPAPLEHKPFDDTFLHEFLHPQMPGAGNFEPHLSAFYERVMALAVAIGRKPHFSEGARRIAARQKESVQQVRDLANRELMDNLPEVLQLSDDASDAIAGGTGGLY